MLSKKRPKKPVRVLKDNYAGQPWSGPEEYARLARIHGKFGEDLKKEVLRSRVLDLTQNNIS